MDPTPLSRGEGISLREYVDLQVAHIDQVMALGKAAAEASIGVYREDLDRRLDAMNELRDQINTERNRYVTRDAFEAHATSVAKDLRDVQQFMARSEGKASQNSVMIALALSIIGLALAAVGLFR